MQRKNCLFERLGSKHQTPQMLFKKSEFGQVEYNVPADRLSQFNFFPKGLCDGEIRNSSFFATPPMEKKSIVTPKAPVKNKKESKRADLKPKRLQYSEEELDNDYERNGKDTVSGKSSTMVLRKRDTVKYNSVDVTRKQITKPHTKLDKIKTQTNDKENDSSAIGSRSKNSSNVRNNLSLESSIVFDSRSEVLSQSNDLLDWKGKLYWLQVRRDVGMWIQCSRSKCKKWRYVEDYHDPSDVPKIWHCDMNSDKSIASCVIPEVPKSCAIEADLIENSYNAGSIVWAYIRGYPWWPAIVCDCPKTFQYYKLYKNSNIPKQYFVTFFSDKLEYAWINKSKLKPFAKTKYSTLITETKIGNVDYKSALDKGYETALNALSLSISKRLQKFSFLALYEKLYDINNNTNEPVDATEDKMETSSDEEIPPTNPPNSLPLKDYYFTIIRKTQDYKSLRY
ncbi:uncharacterized protein LOC144474914 [Augochlora pura]